MDAIPLARAIVPDLRFLVVTGPRIDPGSLPRRRGVTVRGFVPDLYRHLAACDLAVVQGGLTTCMELTANRRPFLYFPLANHFEQQRHVAHRLDRYGAGRRMDYATADPDEIAAAIALELERRSTTCRSRVTAPPAPPPCSPICSEHAARPSWADHQERDQVGYACRSGAAARYARGVSRQRSRRASNDRDSRASPTGILAE